MVVTLTCHVGRIDPVTNSVTSWWLGVKSSGGVVGWYSCSVGDRDRP
jgi:hypothetical protein